MKKILLLLLSGMFLGAAAQDDPAFSVRQEADGSFKAQWRGKELIVREGFTVGIQATRNREDRVGRDVVLNRSGRSHRIDWRREAGTRDGGRELEISFQERIPAFHTDFFKQDACYWFEIPLEALKGMRYTGWVTGRKGKIDHPSGVISEETPDNKLLGGALLRQIAFEGPQGKLVFDCNPTGVCDLYSTYTIGSISGLWAVQRRGDAIRFTVGTSAKRNGGVTTGKVVIYEGTNEDYDLRHAHRIYRYYSELPAEKRLVFGAEKFGKGRVGAHDKLYRAEQGFGWRKAGAVRIERYRPQGALYSACSGQGPAKFRLDLPRPGLYLVNLAIATGDREAGAMSVAAQGRTLHNALTVPPRTVQKITVPVWVTDGALKLHFDGAWRISTLDVQLLMAQAEDASFRRGFWRVATGDEPSPTFGSSSYAAEPEYRVALSSYPLPEPGRTPENPRRPGKPDTHYGAFDPVPDWFRAPSIGSWGPSNAGTFTEFGTPEAVARNLEDIRKDNINLVMFNGMLARHTFPAHRDRVDRVIRAACDAGHKFGIRFIDHIDYSMLWNSDSGFRVLAGWTDRLQETIEGGLPGRARCMVNPRAVEPFYDEIIHHIQATGIDGIMIDECCFMGETFCGCAECRKAFTRDTGYELPADELSPELYRSRSELWKAWQEWRRHKIGEFWLGLRKRVAAIRPDFLFIGYTTDYGMTGAWAANELAGDIFHFARSWDMIGTEIMPRNIFVCARSVYSMRRAFGLFGNGRKRPVFGLVYASEWRMKYFGWALNNMNGQSTWETIFMNCPEGAPNYRRFAAGPDNMDALKARSGAETALLFSAASRNFAGGMPGAGGMQSEILGTSQMLRKLHIDHDFVDESQLTPEMLKRYKVLILGNASALGDEALKEIRKFLEAGGTVAASYSCALGDEWGSVCRSNVLMQWLGLPDQPLKTVSVFAVKQDGKAPQKLAKPLSAKALPKGRTTGAFQLVGVKDREHPAVREAKVGKGRLVYYPALYGQGNAATEVMVGSKWQFEPDMVLENLQKGLLEDLAGATRRWEAEGVPEDVFSSVWEQDGAIYLHLLNAVGSMPKRGTVVTAKLPEGVFPPPVRDWAIGFRGRRVTEAYAVSPEWEGRRELRVTDGRVILPKGMLGVYLIVVAR